MCSRLSDELCFYVGVDAYSRCGEASCAVLQSGCCCLCCGRCLGAQRHVGRSIAAHAGGSAAVVQLASHSSATAGLVARSFSGTPTQDPEWTVK